MKKYWVISTATVLLIALVLAQPMQSTYADVIFAFSFGPWEAQPSGDGKFANCSQQLGLDNQHRIYVADENNARIQVFDSAGNFLFNFGSGQNLGGIHSLAVDRNLGRVITATGGIKVFDLSGNFLFQFGSAFTLGIAVDSASRIYTASDPVLVFDSAGNPLFSFASGIVGAQGIAVDGAGRIIVSGQGTDFIRVFDSAGNFLFQFGGSGSGDGQFTKAHGLAVDSFDRIYVANNDFANRANNRIQVFNSAGTFLFKFGGPGVGPGQFNSPQRVFVDDLFRIYVSQCQGNTDKTNRVQVFNQVGSISGNKFHDINANGIKDLGEPGLQGWTIKLSGAATISALTDVNGNYQFTNLLPGTYKVCEQISNQPGFIQSFPISGAACTLAGEAPLGYSIQLQVGQSVTKIDFGNFRNAMVLGEKFLDKDNDGNSREIGEPVIPGTANDPARPLFKIQITGTDGMGNAVSQTITQDSNGAYKFTVKPGTNYKVCEINPLPSGWSRTFPGRTEATDCHNIGTLSSGLSRIGLDFGNFTPDAVKTIHAEKEIIVNLGQNRIKEVTIYAEIYEDLFKLPRDPVINKQVEVVTCEKLLNDGQVLKCENSIPPADNGVILNVQNCVEQAVTIQPKMNTVQKFVAGSAADQLDGVNTAVSPFDKNIVKTIEAQKEQFSCENGAFIKDVVIFTEIFENLNLLPNNPVIMKQFEVLTCLKDAATLEVLSCVFSPTTKIFP